MRRAWEPAPTPRQPRTRGRPSLRRRGMKARPRTPVISIDNTSGSKKELLKKWLKKWLLPWVGRSKKNADARTTAPAAPSTASTIFRPTFLSVEREAAAASAGFDLPTFNVLMDLQHRDLTPEDYDTLRRARTKGPDPSLSSRACRCALHVQCEIHLPSPPAALALCSWRVPTTCCVDDDCVARQALMRPSSRARFRVATSTRPPRAGGFPEPPAAHPRPQPLLVHPRATLAVLDRYCRIARHRSCASARCAVAARPRRRSRQPLRVHLRLVLPTRGARAPPRVHTCVAWANRPPG